MNTASDFTITPDTRVGELLESRPDLEEVLLGLSPRYKALQNPVLRRTVARVASLRQVAIVGNIPLNDLIRELRRAAGQDDALFQETESDAGPEWAVDGTPVATLDIRPSVAAGEHPMELVMNALKELAPGEILELKAPFVPAPLMDLAEKQGFRSVTRSQTEERVLIWFYDGRNGG